MILRRAHKKMKKKTHYMLSFSLSIHLSIYLLMCMCVCIWMLFFFVVSFNCSCWFLFSFYYHLFFSSSLRSQHIHFRTFVVSSLCLFAYIFPSPNWWWKLFALILCCCIFFLRFSENLRTKWKIDKTFECLLLLLQ